MRQPHSRPVWWALLGLASLAAAAIIDADSANDRRFPQILPRVAGFAGLVAAETFVGSADLNKSAQDVDPNPPPMVLGQKIERWSFEQDAAGWAAIHDSRISVAEGRLKIVSTGDDPYLVVKVAGRAPGPMVARIRVRSSTAGTGQFFWTSDRWPRWSQEQSTSFDMDHDDQWHEYSAVLDVQGRMTGLRLDPGSGPGTAEVAWIEVQQASHYPLTIERMETTLGQIRMVLRNRSDGPLAVSLPGQALKVEGGQTAEAVQRLTGDAAFEAVSVLLEPKGLTPIRRTVVVARSEGRCEWITCQTGRLTLHVARDGSGAKLLRDGKLAALVAPLVLADGAIPRFQVARQQGLSLELAAEGIRASLMLSEEGLAVDIRGNRVVEGPVVRAVGNLEQGLFSGLEYLGKGERSSSTLDIETADHVRFAPDVLKVTMPLMSCVTDRASVSVAWSDMSLQPTFASPDFVDGVSDQHRMSLRGAHVEAMVRVSDGTLEDAILWAVRRRGLPSLPRAPRDAKAQLDLAMAAINGPIKGPDGWGHCAEPKFKRHPYADILSTIWRITGQSPSVDRIVPSGAHIRNDSIYFVTGRAQQWLNQHRARVKGILASQRADGSFGYRGIYQRGHYEDTASGVCAEPTLQLLEFAQATGDRASLEAGLRSLDTMKRFREPRGAQTWELSLHTPDILASANLVRAYVRGYELTGKRQYLESAHNWALSGVPFVYLWGRYPIMLYSTTPVYGATNYRSPLWIGLPVQWCGGVYAYALTMLAPYDDSLDWKHLARGIYIAAQQIQYPDGPKAGCLPDVFALPKQYRDGPSINPGALVSLQLALEGKVDSLAVAADKRHRVAAPFAVTLLGNQARIEGVAGLTYQVLVDGRVVEIHSQGRDVLNLE